jgi:hypothetical protein
MCNQFKMVFFTLENIQIFFFWLTKLGAMVILRNYKKLCGWAMQGVLLRIIN